MRRRDPVPLPSAERWLLSWADFVTLLLALFAAMYAGASVDQVKSEAVALAVGSALGAPQPHDARRARPAQPDAGLVADPADPAAQATASPAEMLADELRASLAALGLGARVQVTHDGDTVGMDIGAELLFHEGEAVLSKEARELLTRLAQLLRTQPYAIRVEGHTDSKPIGNDRYASNWELSAARAAVVVRQLIASGMAEQRMTAVGMAANQPLEANDSAAGRARNRRVHLVLAR